MDYSFVYSYTYAGLNWYKVYDSKGTFIGEYDDYTIKDTFDVSLQYIDALYKCYQIRLKQVSNTYLLQADFLIDVRSADGIKVFHLKISMNCSSLEQYLHSMIINFLFILGVYYEGFRSY